MARFGLFEADLHQRVLTRSGLRVRLQDQPFQLLALLLERPGEVVTREQLREKLWPADNYVEFDAGLNTAIKKLRLALGDLSDNPRFIETVHRRGYRFIAPVGFISESQAPKHDPGPVQNPVTPLEEAETAPRPRNLRGRRYVIAVIAGLMIPAILGGFLIWRAHRFRVTPADSVVIADFTNTTGETIFDDALREATEVELRQSPSFDAVSARTMATILKQMGRAADAPVSGRTAIELCLRAGKRIVIQGSISSIGTTYLVGLAAIRCDNGSPIALEQGQARRKEDVVDALGNAAARLRASLGESLSSIQKYDVPLEQATTSSLDALKAYSQALSIQSTSGDLAAVPFFKRAIELDANFGLAYGGLAAVYRNLGESDLSRQSAAKAFEFRDRVTDVERLSIEGWYDIYVRGDLETAAEVFEVERKTYPVTYAFLNDLGVVYGSLGEFEKEAEIYRESLRLGQPAAATYGNLAVSLMATGHFDEADAVLAEASKKELQSEYLLEVNYWRAFLRGDDAAMQRIVSQSITVPGGQSLLLLEQANTEAYHGHFKRSREFSQNAAELLRKDGEREALSLCIAQEALREIAAGDASRARKLVENALNLFQDQHVLTLSALALVQTGDIPRGRAIAEKLAKQYPSGTFIQKYWIPLIYAEIEVQGHHPAKALALLSLVEALDMAAPEEFPSATLYPVFVRGEAYLELNDGVKAADEFKKLTERPGVVLNFPLGALAHLELARAYASIKDRKKAGQAYRDFSQLWKDADPSNSVLRQSTLELSRLQQAPLSAIPGATATR